MKVARGSVFEGHQGNKKTINRIQNTSYLPGMQSDITAVGDFAM